MHDVIIIGNGPAGMSAGIYASRAGLDVLAIEKMFSGGQAATTYEIENYPGFENISGMELAMKMEAHAVKMGVEISNAQVDDIQIDGKIKKIYANGKEYTSQTVILAMGGNPKELGIEGERRLKGAGVSYCATCDGAFFKGKEVAVVGGGNVAVEDALYLAQFCPKVHLIHRRNELRADKALHKPLIENEKINIIWDTVVEEINGEKSVEGLLLSNVKSKIRSNIAVSGIFVAVGSSPDTSLVAKKLKLSQTGHIITDNDMKTGIDGVFAAGDVREKSVRQVVTAVADGAIAATMAAQYISIRG